MEAREAIAMIQRVEQATKRLVVGKHSASACNECTKAEQALFKALVGRKATQEELERLA